MSEHTPGPWRVVHRHIGGTAGDDEMAGLGWDIEGPEQPQLRGQFSKSADAHLIGAAPELLAFAEMYVERVQDYLDMDDECPACECGWEFCGDEDCTDRHFQHKPDCFFVIARAAIAKATPQQEGK